MNTIDDRIVQMEFDNAQFESNVKTTMSTLDKLKSELDFFGSAKSLSIISDAVGKIDVSALNDLTTGQTKYWTLIGRTINNEMDKIAEKITSIGNSLAKELTVNPVSAGLSEYQMQLDSIQTILANTKSKGSTMEDVTAALDELNTYADYTIYNFSQMTKNIGTFTAAGVGLKTSVASIKGIANLAAVSGSNANQASMAMYQLSQAIAAGTVKLQDWNSVVNAGMGGETFQKALERTAKVMGTGVEEAMASVNGSFRESLSKGWLTSDVLTETLAQISGAYDEAALKAKGYSEEQAKAILDLAQTATEAATQIKSLPQLIDVAKESLGSGWTKSFEYLFGNFEQAKETFTKIGNTMQKFIDMSSDARNSVLKDWSDMGGRRQLITGLANAFWSLAAVVLSVKKAFTDIFPTVTGKTLFDLTKKFREFTATLMISKQTSESIQGVFRGVFSVLKAGLSIVSAVIKLLTPAAKVLLILADCLLTILAPVGDLIAEFVLWVDSTNILNTAISAIITTVGFLLVKIVQAVDGIIQFVQAVANLPAVQKAFSAIGKTITNVYNKVAPYIRLLIGLIGQLYNTIRNIKLPNVGTVITTVVNGITKIYNKLKQLISGITKFGKSSKTLQTASKVLTGNKGLLTIAPSSGIVTVLNKMVTGVKNLASAIKSGQFNLVTATVTTITNAIAALKNIASKAKAVIVGFFSGLVSKISQLRQMENPIKVIGDKIKELADKVHKFISGTKIGPFFDSAIKALDTFKGSIADFVTFTMGYLQKLDPKALLAFAFGVGLVALVYSLNNLAVESKKAMTNVANTVGSANTLIRTFNTQMTNVMNTLNSTVESFKKSKIMQVGVAVALFAASLYALKDIEPRQLIASAAAISTIATAMGLLSKACDTGSAQAAYTMAALGAGVLAIALAFNTLGNVQLDSSLAAKLIVLATAIAGLAAGSIALATFAPQLSKGSIALLAYAAAINLVVGAIAKLADVDFTNIDTTLSAFVVCVGMMAVVAMAAKNVKFTTGAGMLLMIASIYAMEMAMYKIANTGINWDTIKANLDKFAAVLGGLTSLAVTARIAGQAAMKAGAGVILASAGIALIVKSIKELGAMRKKQLEKGLEAIGEIGLILGALVAISHYAQYGSKAGVAMAGAGVALKLIVGVMKTLADLATTNIDGYNAAIDGVIQIMLMLTACTSIMMAVSKQTEKANGKAILAMVGMLGAIVAGVSVLSMISDWQSLIGAGASLGLVLAGLGAAFYGLSKIQNGSLKSVLIMTSMIAALAGATAAIVIVSQQPWDQVIAAAVGIAGVMAVMAGSAKLANDAVTGAMAMVVMSVPMASAALALSLMPILDWDQMLVTAGGLAGVMVAMAGSAKLANDAVTGAMAMVVLAVPLAVVAAALALIATPDWDGIVAAAGSLSVTMLAIAAAALIANGALVGAAAMVVLSVAVVALSAALTVLSTVPSNQLESIATTIIELAGAITALGALVSIIPGASLALIALATAFLKIGVGAAAFGVAAYLIASAVDIFVDAMVKLGNVGPEQADNIRNTISQIGLGIGEGLANVLVGFASTLLKAISDAIGDVIEWIQGKVSDFTEKGCELLDGLGLGFLTKPTGVSDAVTECIDWVAGLFDDLKGKLKKAGEDALTGLQEGISAYKSGGIVGVGKWAGGKILEGFNKVTGHHSPWKTMIVAGKDMVRGLEKGIDKGDISETGKDTANNFLDALRDVWGWHSPWTTGEDAGQGGIAGVVKGFSDAWAKAKSKVADIGNQIKEKLTAPLSNLQQAFSDKFGMGADNNIISGITKLFPGLMDMLDSTGTSVEGLTGDSDALADALGSVGTAADSAGSSVGSAGTATSDASTATQTATQNLEQNAKFLKYSAKVVQAYTKQYGKMNDTVGDTSSVKEATEAITLLATKIYDSEQAYKQTVTTAEEAQTRIDGIKKSFVSLYESIQSGLESSLKANEEFDYKFGTTTKSMLSNISSQITGFNDYSTAITEMLQRGFDADAIKEYVDSGVSSIGEISALLMMSRSEINKWNSDYKKLTDIKENGADGLVATIAKATMQANVDIEKSSKEAHDTILKYAEDASYKIIDTSNDTQVAAADSSKAIVASADIAKEAYNDTAKLAYVVVDANGKVADSFYEIGEQATEQSHVVETAYKAIQQSIEDTLESQRKFFEEFDTGEDDEDAKTAEDYLDMMQSQIDGTRQWSEMLENISNTLGDTSGAKEFVEYLASLGTDGYKYVKAFNDASEDELESAVHRYAEIMQLSGTQSEQIAGTFRDNGYYSVSQWSGAVTSSASSASEELVVTADAAGENFGLGYVKGMQSTVESAKAQANTLGLESLSSLQTALQEHSPSKATEEMGTNLGAGLQNGINSSSGAVVNAGQTLASAVLFRFNMDLGKNKFEELGKNIVQGLIDGMQNSTLLGQVVKTATDLATKAYNAAKEALDINSPSKKFRSLGKSAVEGFSQGFRRYSAMSTKAAEDVSNDALSAVSDVIEAMNIASDDGLDIQPTITPVVDMSNVSAASGMLNGYFGQVPIGLGTSLSSNSMISDALQAISQNSNNDVVSAIKELRSDVQYLGQAIGQAKVTLDTGVIAGAVTPGVSARINKQVSSRGSVWK